MYIGDKYWLLITLISTNRTIFAPKGAFQPKMNWFLAERESRFPARRQTYQVSLDLTCRPERAYYILQLVKHSESPSIGLMALLWLHQFLSKLVEELWLWSSCHFSSIAVSRLKALVNDQIPAKLTRWSWRLTRQTLHLLNISCKHGLFVLLNIDCHYPKSCL